MTPPFPQGSRVLAIGVDLVDVDRVRESLQRFPDRFARRVLSDGERTYCLSRPDPAPHVAARFAAKEAVIKCLGGGCALNEIEVVRALSGSPYITLHGRARARAGAAHVLISLTHLNKLAAAFATLIDTQPDALPEPLMTIREILRLVTTTLESGGIPRSEAASEARTLVLHTTQRTPESLRLHPDDELPPTVTMQILQFARRRAAREPLAYILGTRDFYGLTFRVTPAVLIPRPETEFVVEAILGHVANRTDTRIADLGTGSGAIAIAVATRTPDAMVWASDISFQALEVAEDNARAQAVESRLHFAHGDLLAPVTDGALFDVIASNPPYIAPDEIARLEPEVRDWEPCLALGIHPDALHFYRRLAVEAPPLLKPGGMLVVEVGMGQSQDVAGLWRNAGLLNIKIMSDYAGIPRVVSGYRPG